MRKWIKHKSSDLGQFLSYCVTIYTVNICLQLIFKFNMYISIGHDKQIFLSIKCNYFVSIQSTCVVGA